LGGGIIKKESRKEIKIKKMTSRRTKNFSIIILTISAIFGLAFFVSQAHAGSGENGRGWLGGWSQDGLVPANYSGLGWISLNNLNGAGTISYGVNIPAINGAVSGYAWSSNVGWIDFAPSGPYPALPNNSAQRSGNILTGWARILSIKTEAEKTLPNNAGGWLGWIKLSGTALDGSTYGVDITKMDGTGASPTYAWSDELGWIDFSKASIGKTIIATLSATPSIVANSTIPVSIKASITGGTAIGNNIIYDLDCTNDGSIEKTYSSTIGELSHTFSGVDACTYSANSYAAVKITRDGVNVTPTTTVIIGCVDNFCETTSHSCATQLKTSGCNPVCIQSACQEPSRPRDLNWREVAPN
jgi:hypothetical protein